MDYEQIEMMIRKKQSQSGLRTYVYPGKLADEPEDQNGADIDSRPRKHSKS